MSLIRNWSSEGVRCLVFSKPNNKAGSFTVYASVIASGMAVLIYALISSAMTMYVEGVVPAMGRVHATAILAEYDTELYDRYGIMAFYGNESMVAGKLRQLQDYTFRDKNFIECEVDSIDIYSYSLADQNNLLEQIKLCQIESFATSVLGSSAQMETSGESIGLETGRKITSERIINTLPSAGRGTGGFLESITGVLMGIGSPSKLIKSGTDAFLLNKYIDSKFGDASRMPGSDRSYLLFEKEYIIAGKLSDAKNLSAVKHRIITMREVVNLAFLECDEKMRAEATAIGQVLSLGSGGEVATQAVMATWAYLESLNDYELLINGKKVDGLKDHVSWAVDKDSMLNGWNGDYIEVDCPDGDTYSDYLDLLIYMLPQDTKLLRIMDLIQINMRYYYRSDFLISDHNVGLDYSLLVNGKEYFFSDSYGKR